MHWAAAEFDWPGHTEADLFAVNKVLNEPDFAPLIVLHDVMIAMKLGRHYKGEFRLTKSGQALADHSGRMFGTVVPFFLFRINHAGTSRFDDAPILGNLDVFLNVLNVETEDGATGAHLRRVFFGEPVTGRLPRYDAVMCQLYIQILRPLCWAGLLHQACGISYRFEEAVFMKTPLWRESLRLGGWGGSRLDTILTNRRLAEPDRQRGGSSCRPQDTCRWRLSPKRC